MRRPLLAGLVLLLVPTFALAGKTVTEGNNTLKVKAKFDPAKASKSKQKRRATELTYNVVSGTTNDTRLPDIRSATVFLGGARFGFNAFKKCDETDAATDGDGVCPAGSRVGEGTAVAEIHPPDDPNAKNDLEVDVTLYNGELDTRRDGSPASRPRKGLIVYTEVLDTPVVLPFWAERRNRQITFYGPKEDPDPANEGLYAIKEIRVKVDRKTVRRNGRRVPFLATPTDCERNWTVTHTDEPYRGQPITAKHKIRCEDG